MKFEDFLAAQAFFSTRKEEKKDKAPITRDDIASYLRVSKFIKKHEEEKKKEEDERKKKDKKPAELNPALLAVIYIVILAAVAPIWWKVVFSYL